MISRTSWPVAEPLFLHVPTHPPNFHPPVRRHFSGAFQILSSGKVHLAVLRMDWQVDPGTLACFCWQVVDSGICLQLDFWSILTIGNRTSAVTNCWKSKRCSTWKKAAEQRQNRDKIFLCTCIRSPKGFLTPSTSSWVTSIANCRNTESRINFDFDRVFDPLWNVSVSRMQNVVIVSWFTRLRVLQTYHGPPLEGAV